MRPEVASIEPIDDPVDEPTIESNVEPIVPDSTQSLAPVPGSELAEFLSGDLQPDRADPDFRRALEERLWKMICVARGNESSGR